jgi:hypothetical protein
MSGCPAWSSFWPMSMRRSTSWVSASTTWKSRSPLLLSRAGWSAGV